MNYLRLKKKLLTIFSTAINLSYFLGTIPAALGQPSVLETVEKSLPAIVDIAAESASMVKAPHAAAAIDKNTGKLLVLRNVKTAYSKREGAGIIIDSSGLIVTNAHTVAQAGAITVTLSDNAKLPGKLVRFIPQEDLAFLTIVPPYPLVAIAFTNSDHIQLGDEIFTVGHSEFLNRTISGGKIIGIGTSAVGKRAGNEDTDMVQVNINVYRGDSGGPLLNREGHLIGLMVAGQVKKDRSSFAIPSNKIKEHYLRYLKNP